MDITVTVPSIDNVINNIVPDSIEVSYEHGINNANEFSYETDSNVVSITVTTDTIGDDADVINNATFATAIVPVDINNTNILPSVRIIDIVVAISLVNSNNVNGPIYIETINSKVNVTSIVNTNTITGGSASLNFYHLPTSIINVNTFGPIVGIANNKLYETNSINNTSNLPPPVITITSGNVLGAYNNRITTNRPFIKNFIFSDLSLDFLAHPLTGDIAILYDKDAINQSLKNILLTKRHERFFEKFDVASRINELLFELYDNMLNIELKKEIKNTISNYEPRIELLEVTVVGIEQTNQILIKFFYRIRTFERIEEFTHVLNRT